MSNATGYVYLPPAHPAQRYGERVGFFIYGGTCDVAYTRISATQDEAWSYNRKPEGDAKCSCGQPPVPVILHSTYGGGADWASTACLKCGAITGYLSQYEEDEEREQNNGGWWG